MILCTIGWAGGFRFYWLPADYDHSWYLRLGPLAIAGWPPE